MHEEHAGKNFPRPSAETLPFWEGCRAGELRLQRCTQCAAHQFYPRMLCSTCGGAELAWVRASGRGSIRSYTVVRRPVSKAYAAETPYVVALIDLEEGPTMMSNVIGCDPAALAVGAAVEVSFESWSEEISVPKFRLLRPA
jgi:hypothetical protein